jgi:hypothetical protein
MAIFFSQHQELERRKLRFLMEFLPTLVGREFHMPRGYGHAEYVIHGGAETWRQGRDRIKSMVDLSGSQLVLCNHGGNAVVAIVVERLGGYNGKPTLPSLQEILNEFQGEEVV